MFTRDYYVYITASASKRLYVGVTNSLGRRIVEHKSPKVDTFARKYAINKLVYFEHFNDIHYAIAREKQIKGWIREKKIALIEKENPEWKDLSKELFPELGEETFSDPSLRSG